MMWTSNQSTCVGGGTSLPALFLLVLLVENCHEGLGHVVGLLDRPIVPFQVFHCREKRVLSEAHLWPEVGARARFVDREENTHRNKGTECRCTCCRH